MNIPIKTIEQVSIKDTNNSAYLFVDASDNILKMKVKGKFYSFNLTNEPSTTGKPDLIASGFSENQYSYNSLIPTNKFNGTWIYTQQDNGRDVWVHESGEYQLCLPSYNGVYNYPVWQVFLAGNDPDNGMAGEFWEIDSDHGSAYSSPIEVKQWQSQSVILTGKFAEKIIIYRCEHSPYSSTNFSGNYVEYPGPTYGNIRVFIHEDDVNKLVAKNELVRVVSEVLDQNAWSVDFVSVATLTDSSLVENMPSYAGMITSTGKGPDEVVYNSYCGDNVPTFIKL